jgi:membrane-bound serine protease (ClpP class)
MSLPPPFPLAPSAARPLGPPFRGLARAVLGWLAFLGLTPEAIGVEPPARQFQRGVLIRVEGPISPMREKYLERKLQVARDEKADLVVVEIDSPGGLVESSFAMAEQLQAMFEAHTVAFVPRQALSGAAIAALGSNEIVMAANARLGDAGPIYLGEGALFRHVPEKLRSDLARRIRDLAEATGRPPALAEAMVDMDLEVFRVRNRKTGQTTFMSEAEIRASINPDEWEKLQPVFESRKGHFLEVSGTRAIELQLAAAIAADRLQLKEHYRLPGEWIVIQPNAVDTAVYVLNLPVITWLLLVCGLIALYIELSAPGISLGGLIAGLCFALFFWSRFLGGTAGWLEVVLFAAGLVFLAVELFVLPGFGLAGMSGLLLILASLVLASQDFVIPTTERQWGVLTQTLLLLITSGLAVVVAGVVLSRYLGRIPVLDRLALQPPPAEAGWGAAPGEEPESPLGVRIGDEGVAASLLRPAGRVRLGERYVDVVTEGSFVDPGTPVRVIQVRGNRVVVRALDAT